MATGWLLGKVSDALAPTVAGAVSAAGSAAGGAVSAVGSGINGVGSSINSTAKHYGNGVTDYGNAIKDWTKAPGARVASATNPLGLSGDQAGGKAQVFSGKPITSAPSSAPKALPALNLPSASSKPKLTGPPKPGATASKTSAVAKPGAKPAAKTPAKPVAGARPSTTPKPATTPKAITAPKPSTPSSGRVPIGAKTSLPSRTPTARAIPGGQALPTPKGPNVINSTNRTITASAQKLSSAANPLGLPAGMRK